MGGSVGWTAPADLGEACHLLGTQRSLQHALPTPHNRISGDRLLAYCLHDTAEGRMGLRCSHPTLW